MRNFDCGIACLNQNLQNIMDKLANFNSNRRQLKHSEIGTPTSEIKTNPKSNT